MGNNNDCTVSIIGWIIALIGIPSTYYFNKLLKRKEIEMDKIREIKEIGKKLAEDIENYWACCTTQKSWTVRSGIKKELKTVSDYMGTTPYELYDKVKQIIETIPMFPWDRWRLRNKFLAIVSIFEEIKDEIPKFKQLPAEINIKIVKASNKLQRYF